MKISISKHTLVNSIEWLHQYVMSSFNMQQKYLTPKFVLGTIMPLVYELVPQPETSKTLYRILPLKTSVGSEITLKASNKVVSWTEASKVSDWVQIADDVGLSGDNIYVVKATSKPKLIITPAFQKKVQNKLKKMDFEDNYRVEEYIDLDTTWQKEVVVDGSEPIKALVVYKMEDL